MERSKSNKSIGEILTALTIAVLFLVILLLVVFTARSYQHGADAQYENDTQRVVCAYVATAVKNHTDGEVTPEVFDGCPGICIEDGDTGYAHKIYLHGGELLEHFRDPETFRSRDEAGLDADARTVLNANTLGGRLEQLRKEAAALRDAPSKNPAAEKERGRGLCEALQAKFQERFGTLLCADILREHEHELCDTCIAFAARAAEEIIKDNKCNKGQE